MPQVASKSGYAKPFPLPLSCSYLLGEIQQLSDSSQQLMAGQGGGGCRQSGSRRRSRKHLTQAGTEQWHGYSFSQNCHQLTSSPLPQQQSGGIWAWLHIKLSAHHYPNTSNSSCWWWDHGCLPSKGVIPTFVLQLYSTLLAVSWCSLSVMAVRSSPTTHQVRFTSSYLPTPHTWILTILLHIRRQFTASFCCPAEFK